MAPDACPPAEFAHDLQVPEKARRYAVSTRLPNPVDPADGLVLQYEVKYSEGVTCGGAYLKFFTEDPDFDPTELTNSSPYSVMFGPDKCGATNKVGSTLQRRLYRACLCLTQLALRVHKISRAAPHGRCCKCVLLCTSMRLVGTSPLAQLSGYVGWHAVHSVVQDLDRPMLGSILHLLQCLAVAACRVPCRCT